MRARAERGEAVRVSKQERIEGRLSPETKILIEYAAQISGISVSDFLVSRAEVAAREVVSEHERWVLTRQQSEAFVNALVNPPAPNEALKKAAERHKSQRVNGKKSASIQRRMWGDFTCRSLDGHDCASFACGESTLDDFLKIRARKQHRLFGTTFVVSPVATPLQVAGYYTLAGHSLVWALPKALKKKSPYPQAPVTLLRRFAVSTPFQGRGLGESSLMDALSRACDATADAASFAVVTDPPHERASAFCIKYGFQALPYSPRLFMTMTTIADLGISR